VALSFVADENVEIEVAEAIRALGYEVTHAAETGPGEPDTFLLDMAVEQGRVLITNDKDFGDLVFRRRRPSCGVILVRLPGRIPSAKARLVSQAVRRYGEGLLGAFLVIGTRTMRLRRTPE
jgi:predicted nuclease of predicted toxin-antitoxin system